MSYEDVKHLFEADQPKSDESGRDYAVRMMAKHSDIDGIDIFARVYHSEINYPV